MVSFKILDLFAGVGGLSLGFEMVRDDSGASLFELHRAVEIDKYACQTLRARYGDERVIEGDIQNADVMNKIIEECRGQVSIIVGGIPCQSFSLIGPRSGYGKKMEKFAADERDHLYQHFIELVDKLKPNVIVLENVKGILSKKDINGNLIINKILSNFESLGYNFENEKDIKKYMLLNSSNYGVPQRRERVIIIGIKKEWKDIKVPFIEPTHFNPKDENAENKEKKGLLPYVTLFEAIGDLPKVQPKITDTGLSRNQLTRIAKKNNNISHGEDKVIIKRREFRNHLERIGVSGKHFFEFIRPNGYAFIHHHSSRPQMLSDVKLFSLMREGDTAKTFFERAPKTAQKLIKYDMNSFTDKYRKQKLDEPCTTVFAHLAKDGNRFIHPTQNRTLTPREAARIQSFPDDFIFCGPICRKYKQIGNAVPPLLSKAIAESIVKLF